MAIITYWQDPLTQKTMIPIYKKVMCNMILWQVCFLSLGMFIKNSKGVHPADKIILTQKAKNQIFTYTHELPMGIASQNRFWLIHKLPSWEISDLQFLGH